MVAILYPRRLRELLDVDQPLGDGLPDQGVPVLHSSNSSFVIQTIAAGGGGSFSMGASNLGNTLGQTGVTGSRVVLAGIGNLTLSQLTDANGGTISISGGTAGAGFSAGVSGGNTAGDTGATGTRLVLAGGNNITLSQATDANGGTITVSGAATAAQTVQTQNRFNLTLSGNTAGVLAEVSSGTLTLAGGNGITLSQNGNAITISGPSGGAETQTAISGIAASNTTYTSGTVTFTGSGNITVLSGTGQRVIISGSQSAQTFVGGLAASNTTYTSGTVTITGVGGGVTVSSNTGQRIDISVAAPVAQTGTQFSAGISGGNTSGHSGTVAGRVVFAGGNNITLSGSTNGVSETITISAFSQTVQTQNLHNVTISGNTSGALAAISSGTMTLAGGNNITLSQAGNAVTISGPNVGGAQTGISGLANSETTYTSGSVTFSALGAITIRSTTGQHFQFSVNSQTVQTQSLFSAGVSTGGNTAGDTGVTGTRLVFVGSNNITLSQATAAAGGTVTISGPTTVAQTNQAGSLFAIGNTTSSSSGTYDARTLSISGAGIISIAATNSGFKISATESVQTQNLHNVTLSGNTAGAMAQISSGTMTLAGGNNITLSQAGNAVTISGGAGGGSGETLEKDIAQTAHGLSVGDWVRLDGSGDYVLAQADSEANAEVVGVVSVVADANNFTLVTAGYVSGLSGLTAGAAHFLDPDNAGAIIDTEPTAVGDVSKPVLIADSTTSGYVFNMRGALLAATTPFFLAGMSNIGNTVGDTGITGTRLVLAGTNGITLSQSTNASGGTVSISGITQSAQPGIQHLVVSNTTFSSGTVSLSGFGDITVNTAANIIRISGSQSLQTSNVHNVTLSGNTAGAMAQISSGTMTLAGGNNITLSQAGNAVTISGGAGGGFSAGVSTGGNTQGNTGVTGTRLVIVGTNNITLSQNTDANGGTISISGQSPAGGQFSAGVSTGGNTAGATGITGTQLVWVGSGAMSLSQTTGANGGTVSILGPATSSLVGVSGISVSTNGSTISIMQTTGSAYLTSLAPYDESPMVTGQQGQGSLHLTPVRVPEGVQFDRVGLALQVSNATNSSGSFTLSQWMGFYTKNASTLSLLMSTSISTNFTGSGTVGSYSLYAGPAWQTIPWTSTLPEGDYYAGIITRSTSGGANHSLSQLLLSKFTNSAWSGIIGVASNASGQRLLGQGHYSATTSSLPASIGFTQLVGSGSIVMRSPVWMLRSGTV